MAIPTINKFSARNVKILLEENKDSAIEILHKYKDAAMESPSSAKGFSFVEFVLWNALTAKQLDKKLASQIIADPSLKKSFSDVFSKKKFAEKTILEVMVSKKKDDAVLFLTEEFAGLEGGPEFLEKLELEDDTLLTYAVENNNEELVQVLVNKVPGLLTQPRVSNAKETPQFLAKDKPSIAQILGVEEKEITPKEVIDKITGGDLKFVLDTIAKDPSILNVVYEGETPLTCAIKNGKDDIANILIEQLPELLSVSDNEGETPLIIAIKKENEELTNKLLETRPQILNDKQQETLRYAINFNKEDIINQLLERNPDILNQTDETGNTPLLHAILAKNKPMVEMLLNVGADVKQPDLYGNTPLDHVGKNFKDKDFYAIRTILLAKGKEVGLKQSDVSIEQQFMNKNLTMWLEQKMEHENWPEADKEIARISLSDIPIGACAGWSWLHRINEAIGQEEQFYDNLKKITDWEGRYDPEDKELNTLMDTTLQMLIYSQHTNDGRLYNSLVEKLTEDEETQDALLYGRRQVSPEIGQMLMPEGKGDISLLEEGVDYDEYNRSVLKQKLEELYNNYGQGESIIIAFAGAFGAKGKHATDLKISRDEKGNLTYKFYNPNQKETKSLKTTDFDEFYNNLNYAFGRTEAFIETPFHLQLNVFKYQAPEAQLKENVSVKATRGQELPQQSANQQKFHSPIMLLKDPELSREGVIQSIHQAGGNPDNTVYVFPGKMSNHKPGHTLKSPKEGARLANVAALLTKNDHPLPALSLPLDSMQDWHNIPIKSTIVESAVLDLWRAVGAGYELALPVKELQADSADSTKELSFAQGYQARFGEGDVYHPDPELVNFYSQQLSLINCIGIFLEQCETPYDKRAFLEGMFESIGDENYHADSDMVQQAISNIRQEMGQDYLHNNQTLLQKSIVEMVAGLNKRPDDPWFNSAKDRHNDVFALVLEMKTKLAQLQRLDLDHFKDKQSIVSQINLLQEIVDLVEKEKSLLVFRREKYDIQDTEDGLQRLCNFYDTIDSKLASLYNEHKNDLFYNTTISFDKYRQDMIHRTEDILGLETRETKAIFTDFKQNMRQLKIETHEMIEKRVSL